MSEITGYELLKDMPGAKKGAIAEQAIAATGGFLDGEYYIDDYIRLPKVIVENNLEWFQPIYKEREASEIMEELIDKLARYDIPVCKDECCSNSTGVVKEAEEYIKKHKDNNSEL